MTGQQLIDSALRLLGIQGQGETASGDDSADALSILQDMVDSWQADGTTIFSVVRNTYSIAANQQTWTLGTNGTLSTTRPAKIEGVSIIDLTNASQPNEIPIECITALEWQEEPVKNLSVHIPYRVWDDQGFPTRTLTYYPIPDVACQTAIYSWQALTTFSDLSTDHTFPPAYAKALRYNLALDLAPEFGVINIPAMVLRQAEDSLGLIKRMNFRPFDAHFDPQIPGLASPRKSNIYTSEV